MNINEFAATWAKDEDASVAGSEFFAGDVAVLRNQFAEFAEHLCRHWARPDRTDRGSFVVYPFAGVCRRGVVLASEDRVIIGASIAGNGTPAAVWEAEAQDEAFVRAVIEMHRIAPQDDFELWQTMHELANA